MPIKVVYCLTRRQDLTRTQFQEYWLGQHAEKVRQRAHHIGMVRYVQSHGYDSPLNGAMSASRAGTAGYDGIMEGWWDDEAQALSALSTQEGREAMADLLDDERQFIDFERSPIFMTREHVIF